MKNKITWVIDNSIDPIDNSFISCLNSLNKNVMSFNGDDWICEDRITISPPGDNLIFCRGSIQSINRINHKRKSWITFYDNEQYNCHKYYPYFYNYLLNDLFILMPFSIMLKEKQFIYNIFNGIKGECLFFRPNKGSKIFTGKSIHYDEFEYSLAIEEQCYNVNPEELILIAPHRHLVQEWRIIIGSIEGDDKILASSLYKKGQEYIEEEGCPDKVENFVMEILNNTSYRPHMVFTMDIGELLNGSYKLIEINAFSTCGIYKCNLQPIIEFIEENLETEYTITEV